MNTYHKIIATVVCTAFVATLFHDVSFAFAIPRVEMSFVLTAHTGTVVETFRGTGDATVYCIQDVHCDRSTQQNMSALLEQIVAHHKNTNTLVGVEGSVGTIDTTIVQRIPDDKTQQRVVESLLSKGYLSGAEMFDVYHPRVVTVHGIEDAVLYRNDFALLYRSLGYRDSANTIIARARRTITRAKTVLYPSELNVLEGVEREYLDGKRSVAAYAAFLYTTRKQLHITTRYPEIEKYLHKQTIATTLNAPAIQQDAHTIIQRLQRFLSEQENETLARMQPNSDEFYAYIHHLLVKKHIWLSEQYQQLARYFSYQALVIDDVQLIEELDGATYQLKKTLVQGRRDAMRVAECDHMLGIAHRVMNNTASARNVDEWATNRRHFYDEMQRVSQLFSWNNQFARDRVQFEQAEYVMRTFYAYATKRNEILVANMIQQMQTHSARVGIMIVGGFHAKAVCTLLRSKNISYTLVTPMFSHAPDHQRVYEQRVREQAKWMGLAQDTHVMCDEKNANTRLEVMALALLSGFVRGNVNPALVAKIHRQLRAANVEEQQIYRWHESMQRVLQGLREIVSLEPFGVVPMREFVMSRKPVWIWDDAFSGRTFAFFYDATRGYSARVERHFPTHIPIARQAQVFPVAPNYFNQFGIKKVLTEEAEVKGAERAIREVVAEGSGFEVVKGRVVMRGIGLNGGMMQEEADGDEGDSTHRDATGDEDLKQAAEQGNVIEIKRILAADNCSVTLDGVEQAVFAAAGNGHWDVVRNFLEGEIDISHVESVMGNTRIDENMKDEHQKSLLHYAVEEKNYDEVEHFLLHTEMNFDIKDDAGKTPFHYACELGDVRMVTSFLSPDLEIDVNVEDNEGRTPLHYAAFEGHIEVVKLLLDAGANKDAKTRRAETALSLAEKQEFLHAFDNLDIEGEPQDYENREKFSRIVMLLQDVDTLFSEARKDSPNIEIIRNLLIDRRIPMNARDGDDNTIGELLKVDTKDERGNTLLHSACQQEHMELAQLLVEHGARIDIENNERQMAGEMTPLRSRMTGIFRSIWEAMILNRRRQEYYWQHISVVHARRIFDQHIREELARRDKSEEHLLTTIVEHFPRDYVFSVRDYERIKRDLPEWYGLAEEMYLDRHCIDRTTVPERNLWRPVIRTNIFDDENIVFIYHSKKQELRVPACDIHNILRKKTQDKSGILSQPKKENQLYAAITLVVSETAHYRWEKSEDDIERNYDREDIRVLRTNMRRTYVQGYLAWNTATNRPTIVLNPVTMDNIVLVDFVSGTGRVPRDEKRGDAIVDSISELDDEIQQISPRYDKDNPAKVAQFRHTEQYLRIVMSRNPWLLSVLLEKAKKPKGTKIYAVLLDLCSTRDVCFDCQEMLERVSRDKHFVLEPWRQALLSAGCVVSKHGLRFLPRVSALIPDPVGRPPKSPTSSKSDSTRRARLNIDIKIASALNLFIEGRDPFHPIPASAKKAAAGHALLGPLTHLFLINYTLIPRPLTSILPLLASSLQSSAEKVHDNFLTRMPQGWHIELDEYERNIGATKTDEAHIWTAQDTDAHGKHVVLHVTKKMMTILAIARDVLSKEQYNHLLDEILKHEQLEYNYVHTLGMTEDDAHRLALEHGSPFLAAFVTSLSSFERLLDAEYPMTREGLQAMQHDINDVTHPLGIDSAALVTRCDALKQRLREQWAHPFLKTRAWSNGEKRLRYEEREYPDGVTVVCAFSPTSDEPCDVVVLASAVADTEMIENVLGENSVIRAMRNALSVLHNRFDYLKHVVLPLFDTIIPVTTVQQTLLHYSDSHDVLTSDILAVRSVCNAA